MKYTYEFDDKRMDYVVVRWEKLTASLSQGTVVFRDDKEENAAAMCEEYRYTAECHEWALYNNQESEFDYV